MSGEPTFESIFEDLLDSGEQLRPFLVVVESVLPEAALALQDAAGSLFFGGRPLSLSLAERERLVAGARMRPDFVSGRAEDGSCCYARLIPNLNAVLLFAFAGGKEDLLLLPGGSTLLANTLALALLRQEQEILVADKEQALKQIGILKQQHGKLIEDNYRQYRLNQEREKEYAKKLESEIARQTAELREANARLEEISRLKSDFLANMSHELRTPMNAIIGFTELLSETRLDSEQAEYTKTIAQSAASLLALINDILDLAKIEAGRMEIYLSDFAPAELIEQMTGTMKPLAEKKNIEMRWEVDPELRAVTQDLGKLQQILYNLLSNAVKFTPEGGRIHVAAYPTNNAKFDVVVADTGVGIPLEDQAIIFERFRQGKSLPGSNSLTREYEGTGLGLSIVKELCKLLKGEVVLESEFGKGSTFTVRLPQRMSPAVGGSLTSLEMPMVKLRSGGVGSGGGTSSDVLDNSANP